MKINIEVEQKVQKEIEVETPAYFKDGNRYSLVTETSVINIGPTILVTWDKGSDFYNEHLKEALEKERCEKEEFEEVYNAFISKMNDIVLEKELA